MMNRFVRRILELGSLLWNLVVSTAGGFVFMRGMRLAASEKEEPKTGSFVCIDETPHKPLAGIGAALFLLAFVTSEVFETIRALGH
jgi:hypothetical protein